MKPLLLLPLVVLLQQCTTTPQDPGINVRAFYDENLPSDLSLTPLPILRSPLLEKRWGKPKTSVLPDGSYRISYNLPDSSFESLDIHVAPGAINTDAPTPPPYGHIGFDEKKQTPVPKESPQEWGTATILGKPIHTYCVYAGDGADAASYSSITFPVEKPGFPAAFSVRLTTTSNTSEELSRSYMESVRF